MECLKAEECRGFLKLEDVIWDIDFVGYPLSGEDILIDTLGRVFDLKFDEFLYPNAVIAIMSEEELKRNIIPSLKYSGNTEFEKEVLNEKNLTGIISKMATFFSW